VTEKRGYVCKKKKKRPAKDKWVCTGGGKGFHTLGGRVGNGLKDARGGRKRRKEEDTHVRWLKKMEMRS